MKTENSKIDKELELIEKQFKALTIRNDFMFCFRYAKYILV